MLAYMDMYSITTYLLYVNSLAVGRIIFLIALCILQKGDLCWKDQDCQICKKWNLNVHVSPYILHKEGARA